MAFDNVEATKFKQEQRKFALITRCGFAVQLSLLVLFVLHHTFILSIVSCLLLLPWCIAIYWAHQQRFESLAYLSAVLVFVQVCLCSVIFGIESGLHLLFWPLAFVFIADERVGNGFSFIFALLCIVAFIDFSLLAEPLAQSNILAFLQNTSAESNTHIIQLSTLQLGIIKTISILFSGAVLVSTVTHMKFAFNANRMKLEKLAHIDPLTELFNRRYFAKFIEKQNHQSVQNTTSYCLALGDVDHFKKINDTYGHDVGDIVLKELAVCFNDILAQSDLVCRWGGEEFIVFLPNCNIETATKILEAIRVVISERDIHEHKVTMSFGLVETHGQESLEQLVKRADKLLYKAKSAGRNNIQS